MRINRLVSLLDEDDKACITTLLKRNLKDTATTTLTDMLKDESLHQNEIEQLLAIIPQPPTKPNKNDIPMKSLRKKTQKILIKNNKLKNNSKYKIRENMGPLGKLQLEIGNDINKLPLKHLDEKEINSLTRNWAMLQIKTQQLQSKIESEDEGLLKFNLNQFVKNINTNYRRKKEQLFATISNSKSKKKKRKVLKDKTNKNKNKNENKKIDTTQKTPQTANAKSHLMRQKYSQFIDFENVLNEIEDKLIQQKQELRKIVAAFSVIDQNEKCNQENRWVNPFNQDIAVDFIGQEAFNRYKPDLKYIKNLNKKIKDRKEKLKKLMKQAVWKQTGGLRGKKSMRDRVIDYGKSKERKRKVYKDNQPNKNKQIKDKNKENNSNNKEVKQGNILGFFRKKKRNAQSEFYENNLLEPNNKKRKVMNEKSEMSEENNDNSVIDDDMQEIEINNVGNMQITLSSNHIL